MSYWADRICVEPCGCRYDVVAQVYTYIKPGCKEHDPLGFLLRQVAKQLDRVKADIEGILAVEPGEHEPSFGIGMTTETCGSCEEKDDLARSALKNIEDALQIVRQANRCYSGEPLVTD